MSTGYDSPIQAVLDEFKRLPGNIAYSIQIGSDTVLPAIAYRWNSTESLFCASSFKVFVLAAYLYYAERGELPNQPPLGNYPSPLQAALAEPLTIQPGDHTQGSKVFGELTGGTTASAILAAMIAYSDNTATDIAMKRVGVEKVRAFMYGPAGLNEKTVRIPDSTTAFYKYLSSQPPGKAHLINDTETMVCTADAFADFYQQALSIGDNRYFDDETRRYFKWFLSMADAIPQGISMEMICCMKGGTADYEGEHAMASAGQVIIPGAYFPIGLPVQFALLYNWTGEENYGEGVQAYIKVFGDVFSALWWYAQRGS